MKYFVITFLAIIFFYSCDTTKKTTTASNTIPTNETNDTIRIVNEDLEYEIIIIEVGFDTWLITQRPIWYYANNTLAFRNYQNVVEWNYRVTQPLLYNTNLYEQEINYSPHIDYGIEVNYKLFMYFKFFQQKYKQKLR